ncbi:histidine phosphatase family protein [Thalassovita taeanensis]|uniref:phosphoglycerate mutase (2,3-diphosphoglycerate-dependent) n=1 Tax=Thalassovita taeanensis TaxID=657014 RepID=A0A1H8ZEF3_9RHOB|nr:histidine phosphatase family protein [Thalassovita taeanensis]SEP62810.1 2,3-bisphosphoglycerate-dependent phosphoglycerate mutase [Thalassovita taeanensis]
MAEPLNLAALIRHGEYHQRAGAPSALQPFPLTTEGIEQARACGDDIAARLERYEVTLNPTLHCSPQLRAWQTAFEIAGKLRAHGHQVAEIRETPSLSERSVGSAANLTVEEIEAVLETDPRYAPAPPGWKSDSHYCLPLHGAESLMDAGARVARYLRDVIEPCQPSAPGVLTLFVGHGASFRHGAHHLNVLPYAQIASHSMHHAQPLLLCYNARVSWQHFDGAWKKRPIKEEPLD